MAKKFRPLKLVPLKRKKVRRDKTRFKSEEDLLLGNLRRKKLQEAKRKRIIKMLKN